MQQETPVLEVALFRVEPGCEGRIEQLRAGPRLALEDFLGLRAPMSGDNLFAEGDPRFKLYMEAVEELFYMGHFRPEAAQALS